MRVVFFVVVALAVTGCYTDTTPPDAGDASGDASTCTAFCVDAGPVVDPFGDASLAIRTRSLFTNTCAGGPESGCHSEHAGDVNFTLTLDGPNADVVNILATEMPTMLRVARYSPADSYLFWKVTADPRIDGGSMPLNAPVDPRIGTLINAWIEAGAP